MSIQQIIGTRIREARKKLGLSLKELSEMTEGLKASRITNWEHGTRTPGPDEAKQLGKALQVSAAYLMGLSDDPTPGVVSKIPGLVGIIPILSTQEALQAENIIRKISEKKDDFVQFIPLGEDFKQDFTTETFALRVKDDSMSPALNQHDLVIVNPHRKAQPGVFVVAQIGNQQEAVIREYRQISLNNQHESFELIALNPKWANVTANKPADAQIIGVVCQTTRILLK